MSATTNFCLILDGGLGSELENQGVEVGSSHLWSAEVLASDPQILQTIHRQYIDAGADIVTTASYQASIPGFVKYLCQKNGTDINNATREKEQQYEQLAKEYIVRSVRVAQTASNEFWQEHSAENTDSQSSRRIKPLVAASVGPYGAYLGDGGEYTGQYGLPDDLQKSASILRAFHKERLKILVNTNPDILAIETIPNELELKILRSLLVEESQAWNQTHDTPFPKVWMSLSVNTKTCDSLADGTAFSKVIETLFPSSEFKSSTADAVKTSAIFDAIGVNCLPPNQVSRVLKNLRRSLSPYSDPVKYIKFIVYPNSGELYDAVNKVWVSDQNVSSNDSHADGKGKCFEVFLQDWYNLGARIIGGCCRTGPKDIKELREQVFSLEAT